MVWTNRTALLPTLLANDESMLRFTVEGRTTLTSAAQTLRASSQRPLLAPGT